MSSVQFSFTLSAKFQRSNDLKQTVSLKIFELLFCTEIWAILVILLLMDLPFFIIRLVIIIKYGVDKSYLIYFMLVKNALLCILDLNVLMNSFLDERFLKKNLYKKELVSHKNIEPNDAIRTTV